MPRRSRRLSGKINPIVTPTLADISNISEKFMMNPLKLKGKGCSKSTPIAHQLKNSKSFISKAKDSQDNSNNKKEESENQVSLSLESINSKLDKEVVGSSYQNSSVEPIEIKMKSHCDANSTIQAKLQILDDVKDQAAKKPSSLNILPAVDVNNTLNTTNSKELDAFVNAEPDDFCVIDTSMILINNNNDKDKVHNKLQEESCFLQLVSCVSPESKEQTSRIQDKKNEMEKNIIKARNCIVEAKKEIADNHYCAGIELYQTALELLPNYDQKQRIKNRIQKLEDMRLAEIIDCNDNINRHYLDSCSVSSGIRDTTYVNNVSALSKEIASTAKLLQKSDDAIKSSTIASENDNESREKSSISPVTVLSSGKVQQSSMTDPLMSIFTSPVSHNNSNNTNNNNDDDNNNNNNNNKRGRISGKFDGTQTCEAGSGSDSTVPSGSSKVAIPNAVASNMHSKRRKVIRNEKYSTGITSCTNSKQLNKSISNTMTSTSSTSVRIGNDIDIGNKPIPLIKSPTNATNCGNQSYSKRDIKIKPTLTTKGFRLHCSSVSSMSETLLSSRISLICQDVFNYLIFGEDKIQIILCRMNNRSRNLFMNYLNSIMECEEATKLYSNQEATTTTSSSTGTSKNRRIQFCKYDLSTIDFPQEMSIGCNLSPSTSLSYAAFEDFILKLENVVSCGRELRHLLKTSKISTESRTRSGGASALSSTSKQAATELNFLLDEIIKLFNQCRDNELKENCGIWSVGSAAFYSRLLNKLQNTRSPVPFTKLLSDYISSAMRFNLRYFFNAVPRPRGLSDDEYEAWEPSEYAVFASRLNECPGEYIELMLNNNSNSNQRKKYQFNGFIFNAEDVAAVVVSALKQIYYNRHYIDDGFPKKDTLSVNDASISSSLTLADNRNNNDNNNNVDGNNAATCAMNRQRRYVAAYTFLRSLLGHTTVASRAFNQASTTLSRITKLCEVIYRTYTTSSNLNAMFWNEKSSDNRKHILENAKFGIDLSEQGVVQTSDLHTGFGLLHYLPLQNLRELYQVLLSNDDKIRSLPYITPNVTLIGTQSHANRSNTSTSSIANTPHSQPPTRKSSRRKVAVKRNEEYVLSNKKKKSVKKKVNSSSLGKSPSSIAKEDLNRLVNAYYPKLKIDDKLQHYGRKPALISELMDSKSS